MLCDAAGKIAIVSQFFAATCPSSCHVYINPADNLSSCGYMGSYN